MFERRARFWLSMCFVGTMLLLAGPALAVSTVYTLQHGNKHGFQFSGIHSAVCPDEFCMSGPELFDLDGTISGDLAVGDLTVTGSNISATALTNDFGLNAGDVWTLDILAGMILSDGSGSFDYRIHKAGEADYSVGTFLFAPIAFNPLANQLTDEVMGLWGQNFVGGQQTLQVVSTNPDRRLGIDIGALGAPAPEPSSMALFGVGALLLRGRIRRRSA